MITLDQLKFFRHQYRTNDATVFREYLQLLFLSRIYEYSKQQKIIFKGGTAIHLIFNAPRFSEDLDFTVLELPGKFESMIKKVFRSLVQEGEISFKPRQTIAGKRYLLSAKLPDSSLKSFINLDFSFREKVYEIENSFIVPQYPVTFTSRVTHMSKKEIIAEKIRAIMHRQKGRDIYDLWYLLSQKTMLDLKLIKEKLNYYGEKYDSQKLLQRIKSFPKDQFVNDLKPFVSINDKDKLNELFDYCVAFLQQIFNL